jgi:hypothetical protein
VEDNKIKPSTWFDGKNIVTQVIPESEIYKREWVGLTDEEYQQILIQHDGAGLIAFFNLIEDRLRSKNT